MTMFSVFLMPSTDVCRRQQAQLGGPCAFCGVLRFPQAWARRDGGTTPFPAAGPHDSSLWAAD